MLLIPAGAAFLTYLYATEATPSPEDEFVGPPAPPKEEGSACRFVFGDESTFCDFAEGKTTARDALGIPPYLLPVATAAVAVGTLFVVDLVFTGGSIARLTRSVSREVLDIVGLK